MKASDINSFFRGLEEKEQTEKPQKVETLSIKRFMFKLLHRYHDLAGGDGMTWEREFNNKNTGKRYKVRIVLCEMKN